MSKKAKISEVQSQPCSCCAVVSGKFIQHSCVKESQVWPKHNDASFPKVLHSGIAVPRDHPGNQQLPLSWLSHLPLSQSWLLGHLFQHLFQRFTYLESPLYCYSVYISLYAEFSYHSIQGSVYNFISLDPKSSSHPIFHFCTLKCKCQMANVIMLDLVCGVQGWVKNYSNQKYYLLLQHDF